MPTQRAQDLIKASFHSISQDFTTPLQNCLKAAQQAPPAAPGGYYAPQWPEQAERGVQAHQLGAVSRTAGAGSRSYRLRKRPRHGMVSNVPCWVLVWLTLSACCQETLLRPSSHTGCLSHVACLCCIKTQPCTSACTSSNWQISSIWLRGSLYWAALPLTSSWPLTLAVKQHAMLRVPSARLPRPVMQISIPVHGRETRTRAAEGWMAGGPCWRGCACRSMTSSSKLLTVPCYCLESKNR